MHTRHLLGAKALAAAALTRCLASEGEAEVVGRTEALVGETPSIAGIDLEHSTHLYTITTHMDNQLRKSAIDGVLNVAQKDAATGQRTISDREWMRRHASGERMRDVPVYRVVSDHAGTCLVHEYNGDGEHRLWVGKECSGWAHYNSIAQCGTYAATTQYYEGSLPSIFLISAVVRTEPLMTHE